MLKYSKILQVGPDSWMRPVRHLRQVKHDTKNIALDKAKNKMSFCMECMWANINRKKLGDILSIWKGK
jgi:hypothetical protein